MKNILAVIIMMMSMQAMGQKKYEVYTDTTDAAHGLIYNGQITFTNLDNDTSFTWLRSGEDAYTPDPQLIDYLDKNLKAYNIVIFMGTWCSDSHDLIPKVKRVLGSADFPDAQITMYGVDHEKKTKSGDEKKYGITYVPTIILFQNGREAGRITESVDKSIEADLAAIVKKDMKHHSR